MHDTFWSLFRDAAHWEFELFLMLLFDGLIFGLAWPFLRKHWVHHIARDIIELGLRAKATAALADECSCGWSSPQSWPPVEVQSWTAQHPLQDGTIVDGHRYHSSPKETR